jgi:hypothetical protein
VKKRSVTEQHHEGQEGASPGQPEPTLQRSLGRYFLQGGSDLEWARSMQKMDIEREGVAGQQTLSSVCVSH